MLSGCARQIPDNHDAAGWLRPAWHQVNLNIPPLARFAKLQLCILPLWEQACHAVFLQNWKALIEQ
jgi:hypothetical protein